MVKYIAAAVNTKGPTIYLEGFCSEIFFRTTRELEYIFFFQNLTLGYMTKTLNQIFSPSTKIRIFFLEKSHFYNLSGKYNLFQTPGFVSANVVLCFVENQSDIIIRHLYDYLCCVVSVIARRVLRAGLKPIYALNTGQP
jgi:hypothetical protein